MGQSATMGSPAIFYHHRHNTTEEKSQKRKGISVSFPFSWRGDSYSPSVCVCRDIFPPAHSLVVAAGIPFSPFFPWRKNHFKLDSTNPPGFRQLQMEGIAATIKCWGKKKVSIQIEPTISRSREDGRHDLSFKKWWQDRASNSTMHCGIKNIRKEKKVSTYRYVKTTTKNSKTFFSKKSSGCAAGADLAVGPDVG